MTTKSAALTETLPRYQALARCLDHIRRVRDEPRFAPALDRSLDRLARLMQTAPSGSGFDSGTQILEDRSDVLIFETAFHHMNDGGYYDGWTHHTVRVKPSLVWGFDLTISGPNRNDIKDYIAVIFEYWLNEEVHY